MGTQGSTIEEEVGTIVEEYTIVRDRTRMKQQTDLMLFAYIEGDFSDEASVDMTIEEEHPEYPSALVLTKSTGRWREIKDIGS
ncbi:hypothetical protein CHS0354_037873 [Potamilus streckersoni]|uniref:Uncharacterized protein n=1 Tax=Potamilus streckersoni TaxID=2493646 RepID=A0AAE0W8P3_9BIVA|nr:hypothetical protein CHS0354_037873 [Potamilus streckersoni]